MHAVLGGEVPVDEPISFRALAGGKPRLWNGGRPPLLLARESAVRVAERAIAV